MKLQHLVKVISKNLTVISIASVFALGAFGLSDIKDEFRDTSNWFKPQPETDQTAFENIAEDADANPFEKNDSGLSPELDPDHKESSKESTAVITATTTEEPSSETSDPSEDSSVPSDSEEPDDTEVTSSATTVPETEKPSETAAETTKKKETKAPKETTKSPAETTKASTTATPKETPASTTAAPTETTAAPSETTAAPTQSDSMGNTGGSYNDDMAAAVLTLVNNERAANGKAPLSWSGSLAKAAKTRAAEIVVTWDHKRPDGSEWYTVSDLTYGENLAKGQSSADKVMEAWLNSADHKRNILADYKTIGVACYYCGGKYYWVQEFGY